MPRPWWFLCLALLCCSQPLFARDFYVCQPAPGFLVGPYPVQTYYSGQTYYPATYSPPSYAWTMPRPIYVQPPNYVFPAYDPWYAQQRQQAWQQVHGRSK